jgi:hypothetical protein
MVSLAKCVQAGRAKCEVNILVGHQLQTMVMLHDTYMTGQICSDGKPDILDIM